MTMHYVFFNANNEIHIIFADYFTGFITLIWRLCGCWITEKLAPTKSDIIFADYSTAFITLIWRLCGCWFTEKLAPTQSDIIFGFL